MFAPIITPGRADVFILYWASSWVNVDKKTNGGIDPVRSTVYTLSDGSTVGQGLTLTDQFGDPVPWADFTARDTAWWPAETNDQDDHRGQVEHEADEWPTDRLTALADRLGLDPEWEEQEIAYCRMGR